MLRQAVEAFPFMTKGSRAGALVALAKRESRTRCQSSVSPIAHVAGSPANRESRFPGQYSPVVFPRHDLGSGWQREYACGQWSDIGHPHSTLTGDLPGWPAAQWSPTAGHRRGNTVIFFRHPGIGRVDRHRLPVAGQQHGRQRQRGLRPWQVNCPGPGPLLAMTHR